MERLFPQTDCLLDNGKNRCDNFLIIYLWAAEMVIMDEPFFFSPVSFSVKTRAQTGLPA